MEDNELFEIWKKKDHQEKKVYNKYKEKYYQLLEQKSNDIFNKIRRNVLIELVFTIISILSFILFPFISYHKAMPMPFYFKIMCFISLIASLFSIYLYLTYLKKIKFINEISIVDSLKKKLSILF